LAGGGWGKNGGVRVGLTVEVLGKNFLKKKFYQFRQGFGGTHADQRTPWKIAELQTFLDGTLVGVRESINKRLSSHTQSGRKKRELKGL